MNVLNTVQTCPSLRALHALRCKEYEKGGLEVLSSCKWIKKEWRGKMKTTSNAYRVLKRRGDELSSFFLKKCVKVKVSMCFSIFK